MAEVTIRELRNHGGDVVDRVAGGERILVTRSGRPVAELRPVRAAAFTAVMLLQRWRRLPRLEPESFRTDLDGVIDGRL